MENPAYYNYSVTLDKNYPLQSVISWWTGSLYRRAHGRWVYYDPLIRTQMQDIDYSHGRTKMAAIFVSNCEGTNNRLGYVKELQKYIDVDIFGKCGDKKCAKGQNCFKQLRKYYFYLAFENSNCRDYITEKFRTNALDHEVVPVVLGAHPDDYKNQAPQNSYIHVQHFKSPSELAEYLQFVATNKDIYNSYFEWKKTGEMLNHEFLCSFCAMANYAVNNPVPRELIGSYDWKADPPMCLPNGQWYW